MFIPPFTSSVGEYMNRRSLIIFYKVRQNMELSSNSKHDGESLSNTIDSSEVSKFNNKTDWWDENGSVKVLHTYNNIRIPFLRQCLMNNAVLDDASKTSEKPLEGLKILDVGCGGGFLTEALAKLGADTTGLDAAEDLIRLANDHMLTLDKSIKLQYVHETIEEFAITNSNKFDVIYSSEVIEHVNNPQVFVSKSVECLKIGGSAFFSTVSRNIFSRIFMIWLNEYVTGVIPKGTHEYHKFINPEELSEMLEKSNCEVKEIDGHMFNPLTSEWFSIPTTKIIYAIHAIKMMK